MKVKRIDVMSKRQEEEFLARHLYEEALGQATADFQLGERPDIRVRTSSGLIGIEVTILHADEGAGEGGGSTLRKQEEFKAATTPAYEQFVPLYDPNQALATRLQSKCSSGLTKNGLDELWLLVAGGLVHEFGRLASTYVDPNRVDTETLNLESHALLSATAFDRAYFDIHSHGVLFAWTRRGKWVRKESKGMPRLTQLPVL